jgi:hypothetical protein
VRQPAGKHQHSTQITHRNFPITRGRLRRGAGPEAHSKGTATV